VEPLFSFGHGLSYTQFEYRDMTLDKETMNDTESLQVKVNIKNTGTVAGQEIVQLYVHDATGAVDRPLKELKGFEKIHLKPNEQKTVTFQLSKRDFAYYHEGLRDWVVPSGEYHILIGESSQSILQKQVITIQSSTVIHKTVHRNTTIGDIMADSILGPAFKELAQKFGLKSAANMEESEDNQMAQSMLANAPLSAIVGFSQGKVTEEMLTQAIDYLNGALEKEPDKSWHV